ncbi:MAG: class F sortase [Chloroflexota bacterium]
MIARSFTGSALLCFGGVLVVFALALSGRAYIAQWAHDFHKPAKAQELLPARQELISTIPTPWAVQDPSAPTPEATSSATMLAVDIHSPVTTSVGSSPPGADVESPRATPTPVPTYGSPIRMVIPSIELDSRVVAVGIVNDVYESSWWDVGWHRDSAPLGSPGNTIFNGHVETIDAGRVFARLHQLQQGDMIYLYSPTHRTDWVVGSSERVANTEHSFVAPTEDVRLTLYTCEGQFDWGTRRYSHYRVVIAQFVEAVEYEQ